MEDENFSSTLTLINSSGLQTYATLVVRDAAGNSRESGRINLSPHSQLRIKIAELLESMGILLRSGSLLVKQSPDLKSASILGQMTLVSSVSGSPSYVEEEMLMPGILDSQELRSVSEPVEQSPRVAVTSMSTEPQHVTIQCFTRDEVMTRKAILAPGGSVLLSPCQQERDSTKPVSSPAPAGISIFSDGPNGGFAAFGIASHRNQETGAQYFGGLQFVDPVSMNSSSLVFTAVSSGQSLTPAPANYVSFLSLANFASTASKVVVATYRTSGAGKVTSSSEEVQVGPQSATDVPLGSLSTTDGDVVSIVADAAAPAGEIFGKIISVGNSPPYQIEQLTKDAVDQRNGGSHPWTIEDDSISDLLLFNHSSESQPFNVVIDAGDGRDWTKVMTLSPFQTLAISIRQLIRDQVLDDRKHTLPKGAKWGTVIWQAPAPGSGSGRLLIRSPLALSAQSFSCGQAYVLCDGFVLVDSPITVQGFGSASAIARFCVDYTGGTQCFGDPGFDGSADYTLCQSSDTNVATVGGGGTDPNASTTGISPGSATITATMVGGFGCTVDASAGLSVVPLPDHVKVASDISGALAACTQTVGRKVTLGVVDSQDASAGVVPVQEQFLSLSNNSCNDGAPIASSCRNTDNNTNEFTDSITVNCNNVGGSCGYTIQWQWQWCPYGQTPKPLATLNGTVHNDAITVNGVTTPAQIPQGTDIFP